MCNWISVETELPIIDELVDVIVDDKEAQYNLTKGRFTDVRYGHDGRFYSLQFGFLIEPVTHWMYAPKLKTNGNK